MKHERERTMADRPSLPELRFAETPATSRHRYYGRPVLRHGGGTRRPPASVVTAWHRRQLAALALSAGRPRRSLPANRVESPGYLLSDNLRAERRAAVIIPMRSMTC